MNDLKKMISHIPAGSCPKCSRKQFIVWQSLEDIYLTNIDGNIIDHKEISSHTIGKCINCGSQYEMMDTVTGFIPLTNLRKILFDSNAYIEVIENEPVLPNPMEK